MSSLNIHTLFPKLYLWMCFFFPHFIEWLLVYYSSFYKLFYYFLFLVIVLFLDGIFFSFIVLYCLKIEHI